nr:myb-related protein Hv33 [Ipomoea batatas]
MIGGGSSSSAAGAIILPAMHHHHQPEFMASICMDSSLSSSSSMLPHFNPFPPQPAGFEAAPGLFGLPPSLAAQLVGVGGPSAGECGTVDEEYLQKSHSSTMTASYHGFPSIYWEEMEPAKPVEKPLNEHPDSLSTGNDSPPREPGEFIYFTTSDSDPSSQASRASSTYSKSESSTARLLHQQEEVERICSGLNKNAYGICSNFPIIFVVEEL